MHVKMNVITCFDGNHGMVLMYRKNIWTY